MLTLPPGPLSLEPASGPHLSLSFTHSAQPSHLSHDSAQHSTFTRASLPSPFPQLGWFFLIHCQLCFASPPCPHRMTHVPWAKLIVPFCGSGTACAPMTPCACHSPALLCSVSSQPVTGPRAQGTVSEVDERVAQRPLSWM